MLWGAEHRATFSPAWICSEQFLVRHLVVIAVDARVIECAALVSLALRRRESLLRRDEPRASSASRRCTICSTVATSPS